MSRGFSMIEVMITVALLSLMVGLGLFMSMEAYRGAMRRSERDVIVSLLERARSRAMANIDETSWSVCYDAGDYIIAQGATCDDAHAYDRVEANANVAAASDFAEFPIVFAAVEGTVATAASGEQVLTVVQEGKQEEITINYEGRINW